MKGMSIKEIMNIGCEGFTRKQKEAEKERRIEVAQKVTTLGNKIAGFVAETKGLDKGSLEAKKLNGKIRHLRREMDKIKADESVWMREAAWFMYN